MVSARRTYFDLFLKASSDSTIKGSTLYFYDLNAKVNYRFDDKNRIFISGYFGKDVLGLQNVARCLGWVITNEQLFEKLKETKHELQP